MPLTPNTTILNGKYHILRLIGEGGMARVWLAEEVHFGRQVAIKEPHAGLGSTGSEELRERFQREVKVSAALAKDKTPNIVQALTAEPNEDELLLVMAYMPGGDLETLLEQHPDGLSINRAIEITQDVLVALAAVHENKLEIVHRDIKPSNILFDEGGQAHLADFGLAQVAGWSQGRSVLQGGSHPGTPMYMAPEQAVDAGYLTPAADIYALGCVLFEVLTGQTYKKHPPGTQPSELRSDVPVWLDETTIKMVVENPWQRWHIPKEMAEALNAGIIAERTAQEEAVRQAQKKKRRQKTEQARLVELERQKRKAGETLVADRIWAEAAKNESEKKKEGAGWRIPILLTGIIVAIIIAISLNWMMDNQNRRNTSATSTAAAFVAATKTAQVMLIETEVALQPDTPTDSSDTIQVGIEVVVSGTGEDGMGFRSGPGTSYVRIGVLHDETVLKILGGPEQSDGFNWWRVETSDGTTGWVVGNFITPVSS